VFNESDGGFTDLSVDLFAPGQSDPFQSVVLSDVAGGESTQSIDDLSFLLVPDDLDRVLLRLTFGGSLVTTSLLASALAGDPADLLVASTEIIGRDSEPAPVPEPGTLMLVGVGLGYGALRRWRSGAAGHRTAHWLGPSL
jgi:hypothetical protein